MTKNFVSFRSFLIEEHNEKHVEWPQGKRILIIGYGSVGQAILPMIMKHLTSDGSLITVLEKGEHEKIFKKRNVGNGVTYVKHEVVRKNLNKTLEEHVGHGGYIVDCSLNIGAYEIIEWALNNDCNYINTSLERWADQQDETIPDKSERTLFHTHSVMRKLRDKYPNGPTITVTHGANPGLVTHLTKRALLEIRRRKDTTAHEIPETREEWAQLMKSLGVKVIHVAERDTQLINVPKKPNEFVNTWSPEGFWAEGRAPAEMGWGTHEKKHPVNGRSQGNAAYLNEPGLSVLIKSWVPSGPYNGFCVQHSEAVTISDYFTTKDGKFRPSVYYVYQPSDAAVASVHELRGRELDMQTTQRVVKDEIISGVDELGVLLLGENFGMWHGSQLGIDEARRLIPGESATSIQVVASMLGAMIWALDNPNRGYVEPEEIDHKAVLQYADPYLGPIPYVWTEWKPHQDKNSLVYREFDASNPLSFENFRVWS